MSQYIVELTDILSRELRHYEQMLILLRKKQKALVDSDTDALKRVMFDIEESIARIKNLEKDRSRLLDSFVASRLTRPASDAISWRKSFPDDETSEEKLAESFRSLEKIKDRLRLVLKEVSDLQESNQLLIIQGRDVLESCMHCLLAQVSGETYDSKGSTNKQVGSERKMIDQII